MGLLDGQRAIVTGGGSGIGRATCRQMAAEGAAVSVLDIDGDRATEVAGEIGGTAHRADVTDPDGLSGAVDGGRRGDGRPHDHVQQRRDRQPDPVARVGPRGVGPAGPGQPHRCLPRVPCRRTPPQGDGRREHREHRLDQRHPAGGRRGALRGGQGRSGGDHRHRRPRVRARHPGQRGVTGDDPHRPHRAPARVLPPRGRALRAHHPGRADRRPRGRGRRGGVLVLGPGPLHHRPESGGRRGDDPSRLGGRRDLPATLRPARGPERPLGAGCGTVGPGLE